MLSIITRVVHVLYARYIAI